MARDGKQSSAPPLSRYVVAAAVPTLLIVGGGWALAPLTESRTISAPTEFLDWEPVLNYLPSTAALRDLGARTRDEVGATRVVAADYGTAGGAVRYVGAEGDFADPRAVIREQLTRHGASELTNLVSGRLGGAVACGVVPTEAQGPTVVCGWTDLETLGNLLFFEPELQLEEAAELTADFRAVAEQVTRP